MGDYARVAEAAAALIAARIRVALRPSFARVEGAPPAGSLHPSESAAARDVARAIWAASRRLPFESTCLVQALAARSMLTRRGVSSSLVMGVSRVEGELKAHAWLMAEGGSVVGGVEAGKYQPIARVR